jgi:RNA polymerase sigma-70 factor, ECF subfamily
MRTTTCAPIDPLGDEGRIRRLVAAAQTGDREAMHAIYVAFAPGLRAYLSPVVGRHDAEDVTQQVFAKLMHELPYYRPGAAPFSAWLLRVGRNLAIDHLRRSRMVPCAEVRSRDAAADDAGRDCTESLREALAGLPPVQRKVLLLHHLVGLTADEIAASLGRSVHSVHCLHNRGRSAARTALDDLGAGPVTTRPAVAEDWPRTTPIAA